MATKPGRVQKVLELLPGNNLSQADKNIQRECELDIDYVKSKLRQQMSPNAILSVGESDLPWDRVLKLEEGGKSGGYIAV